MEAARIHSPNSDIMVCVNSRVAKLYVYTLILNLYYSQWFSKHKIRIIESQKAIM
jgi:hypothetical protein